MSAIIICLSAAVLGVDYGWQPVAGGGIEYIIQIEPELLDSLQAGHDLFSDLPPAVSNIRSYRITVGTGRLPHHGEPPPASAGPKTEAAVTGASAEATAPADIDLSQLPGPILGPALILQPPANRPGDDEPPRLVESEAEPLANRVAGYHGKSDVPAAKDHGQGSAGAEHSAAKGPSPDKKEPPGIAVTQPADAGQAERDSASNRALPVSETATSRAVMQLSLFASLCGNGFLLWVAVGQRGSYRALVRRMFENRAEDIAALPPPPARRPESEEIATVKHGGSLPRSDNAAP